MIRHSLSRIAACVILLHVLYYHNSNTGKVSTSDKLALVGTRAEVRLSTPTLLVVQSNNKN